MPIVPIRLLAGFRRLMRPSALLATLLLLFPAACTDDRLTEAPSDLRPWFSTGSVDCSDGCKDTFTAANGTLLSSHSPDVGGFTWQKVEGFGGDYQAKITSNAVSIEDPDTLDHEFMYQIPEMVGEDTVEMELEVYGDLVTTGGNYNLGILLRGNGTTTHGYFFHLQVPLGGGPEFNPVGVDLVRNGEHIPGAARSLPGLTPGIHKFRAEASGGTLKAYLDGVLVTSGNDPVPLPPGNPGFWFGTATGDVRRGSVLRITSFEVRPCGATGDPVLNSPEVREGLLNELSLSRPNPDGSGRAERRGYLYQRDTDGSYFLLPADDPTGTMCGFSFADLPVPPLIQGASFIGDYHTHPSKHREILTGCPNQPPNEVWRANRKAQMGGGSEGDWEFANVRGKSHYIIDFDRKVWRLDANTVPGARKNNPNRWKFRSPTSTCLDRA